MLTRKRSYQPNPYVDTKAIVSSKRCSRLTQEEEKEFQTFKSCLLPVNTSKFSSTSSPFSLLHTSNGFNSSFIRNLKLLVRPRVVTLMQFRAEDSLEENENFVQTYIPFEGLHGEKRLKIKFESFGNIGVHRYPQTCYSSNKCIIPDGITGTHNCYGENWRFQITHTQEIFQDTWSFCVCLKWELINLSTGKVSRHTETFREASIRMKQGMTVANRVIRSALQTHANLLEIKVASLDHEIHSCERSTLENKIKTLRPKFITDGTLIFGLQHSIVQTKIRMLNEKQ